MTKDDVERAGLWASPDQALGALNVIDAFEAGKRAAVNAIVEKLCDTSSESMDSPSR